MGTLQRTNPCSQYRWMVLTSEPHSPAWTPPTVVDVVLAASVAKSRLLPCRDTFLHTTKPLPGTGDCSLCLGPSISSLFSLATPSQSVLQISLGLSHSWILFLLCHLSFSLPTCYPMLSLSPFAYSTPRLRGTALSVLSSASQGTTYSWAVQTGEG